MKRAERRGCLTAGLGSMVVAASWFYFLSREPEPAAWRQTVPAWLMLAVGLAVAARAGWRRADSIERGNREVDALRQSMPVVFGQLSLEATLRQVVDQARELLGAEYGALSVMDDDHEIVQFVTSGMPEGVAEEIGEMPSGSGLLGVPLFEGRGLRVSDIGRDPRASPLPAGHPPMKTLLAVPVLNPVFKANLYLANGAGAAPFDEADEQTLDRFAGLAALAIELSHLHEELSSMAVEQERLRIAREMHDGMAQVLAYVNTKAQAAQQHLRRGRIEEADANLNQLAEAAREVYSEVRESILGLRTLTQAPDDFTTTVEEYLRKWEVHTGVSLNAELSPARVGGRTALEVLRILQESLANVRKHAGASEVKVVLATAGDKMTLSVRDNGRGFDPVEDERGRNGRYGLATMRERAFTVGGTLAIDSRPGGGTMVTAEVPLGLTNLGGPQ